jgi:hypothetical protein
MPELDDPYLSKQLNPLFLRLIKNYWEALLKAQIKEKDLLEKSQMNLLRFVFRRLFRPLYLKYFLTTKNSVFFLSRILSDGIGDYFSLLKCAKIFAEKQPFIDVHIVYTYDKKLPIINPPDFSLLPKNIHPFFEYKHDQILEPILEASLEISSEQMLAKAIRDRDEWKESYDSILSKQGYAVNALEELIADLNEQIRRLEKRKDLQCQAEALYEQMKQSLAIAHIALALNTFDNPDFSSKSMYFSEMGNFQGIGNALQRNWFSMGLHPFDEGVFLKKVFPGNVPWKEEKLPLFLWNTPQPTAPQIAEYFKHHSLHVGYLHKSPQQLQLFIHLICIKQKSDTRTIDIILPKMQIESACSLNTDWLAAQGIQKTVSLTLDHSTQFRMETEAPSEKILRLISCLPLPSSDFENLLQISGDLMGCTGDGSLSDCLAAGKIPFYEQRKHKFETLEAFQQLAGDLNLKHVTAYFDEMAGCRHFPPEIAAEKLNEILRKNPFKTEWEIFLSFIKQHYCFEEAMVSLLNRQILIRLDPSLEAREEEMTEAYFKGKISASEAYETLRQALEAESR